MYAFSKESPQAWSTQNIPFKYFDQNKMYCQNNYRTDVSRIFTRFSSRIRRALREQV